MDTQEDVFAEMENNPSLIPPEILAKANQASDKMYPSKSKEKYFNAYDRFVAWRNKFNTQSFAEPVFIAYFQDLSQTLCPKSLWPQYSMLKSVIQRKHNLSLHNFGGLQAFLKQINKGYQSKKSKVLTAEDIQKFLLEAPDNDYLDVKVTRTLNIDVSHSSTVLY